MKVTLQPAYVLRLRPYRETSALVEVFTQDYGRMGLVAKGVRRRHSKDIDLLRPFCPLLLSWVGRSDLATLTGAETAGKLPALTGEGLICAFYLNELLLRLLLRRVPFEALFSIYGQTLPQLADPQQRQPALRFFERDLLAYLGYGLILDHEVTTLQPIDPEQWYSYQWEKGPKRLQAEDLEGVKIRGQTLQALAQGGLADPASLREARQLLRWLLAFQLGNKPLKSRDLLEELRRLSKKTEAHECE